MSSLAVDLRTHVRLMRLAGHFLPDFDPDTNSSEFSFLRAIYSIIHMALMSLQFTAMAIEMARHFDDMSALTTNTISLLFFLHGPTKVFYFAICRRRFYKTILSWDSTFIERKDEMDALESLGEKMLKNKIGEEDPKTSQPFKDKINGFRDNFSLDMESSERFKNQAVLKMRRLLVGVLSGSAVAAAFWSLRPFFGMGHYGRTSNTSLVKDNSSLENPMALLNVTIEDGGKQQWNLLVDATYPWDTTGDLAYALTFLYQLYWIIFCLAQINLLDILFCSWLIFACEQIRHLKEILLPLMELSRKNTRKVITPSPDVTSADMRTNMDNLLFQSQPTFVRNRISPGQNIFSVMHSSTLFNRTTDSPVMAGGILSTHRRRISDVMDDTSVQSFTGILQPAGTRIYQSLEVDLAIQKATKYWVEKHKHIVRFVECIGDSYGMALLIHMLTSTITLTLLSYEATKISAVDMHALTVITYLFYTLGQVFFFCIYGNNLIEDSTSVMQAAYDSPWYECSEEAKNFIQIVCQQSQRPMSISGAKFFTVSLDLFASVLGAVVTYFMVLIQLK